MKKPLSLYFIALVPGNPLFEKIMQLKQEVSTKYNSDAALRSPPHITLYMPFRWKEEKENQLTKVLDTLAAKFSSFKLALDGYGCFAPRVIYITVKVHSGLVALQKEISLNAAQKWHIYEQRGSRPFHPHMTIAFRDLKKTTFNDAWAYYSGQSFAAHFSVKDVCLLKHDGKRWHVHHRSPLA